MINHTCIITLQYYYCTAYTKTGFQSVNLTNRQMDGAQRSIIFLHLLDCTGTSGRICRAVCTLLPLKNLFVTTIQTKMHPLSTDGAVLIFVLPCK